MYIYNIIYRDIMACKTLVFGINSTEIFHKAKLSKISRHRNAINFFPCYHDYVNTIAKDNY